MTRGSRGCTGRADCDSTDGAGDQGACVPGSGDRPAPAVRAAPAGRSADVDRSAHVLRSSRRRTFLELGSTAAAVALAGCARYLRGDRERRLLETYEDGAESYRTGVDRHNDGAVAYRDDDYGTAVDRLEATLDSLEPAVEAFRTAEGIATELGDGEARRICERAIERSETLVATTTLLVESATAFREGDHERAQARYDEYVERFDAAARGDLPERAALAAAIDDGVLG